MAIESIIKVLKDLEKNYGETDPVRLAKAMNIQVQYRPMGTEKGCCKGFFIIFHRIKHITINSSLPEILQRVILAHEIGHCVLHAAHASNAQYHDVLLFDTISSTEYEANIFASELLLPDDKVLELLNDDLFFFAKKQCGITVS